MDLKSTTFNTDKKDCLFVTLAWLSVEVRLEEPIRQDSQAGTPWKPGCQLPLTELQTLPGS
jgi:hypothetical protein